MALVVQIYRALEGTACRVYVAPFDVRLPDRNEAVTTVVQPDIAVVCDPAKLDDKGCRGAPDWIIEILSPTTAAKDQIQKRALYVASKPKRLGDLPPLGLRLWFAPPQSSFFAKALYGFQTDRRGRWSVAL